MINDRGSQLINFHNGRGTHWFVLFHHLDSCKQSLTFTVLDGGTGFLKVGYAAQVIDLLFFGRPTLPSAKKAMLIPLAESIEFS